MPRNPRSPLPHTFVSVRAVANGPLTGPILTRPACSRTTIWSLGNHSTAVGREKPATAASLNPVGTVAASTIGAVLLNEMTAETATVKLNAIPQRCAVPSVFRR